MTQALDPACGDGAILDVIREMYPGIACDGFEIDEDRAVAAMAKGHGVVCLDALGRESDWSNVDIAVMNPPFSLAIEFLRRAIKEVDTVAALLRLNFLGGQKRAEWHRCNPSDVYVLPRRPSFTGGGTDATEYAWFVWGPGRGNRWEILDLSNG